MKRYEQGFTLIELLIVMLILGGLVMLFTPALLKSQRNAQVRQGVQDFKAQVDQARVQAQRTGRCFRLSVAGGTQGAYSIDKYKASRCTGSAADIESTQTFDASPGTQLTLLLTSPSLTSNVATNSNQLDFRPPYGTGGGLPIDLKISSVSGDTATTLRVTGVMGQVITK